MSLPEDDDKKRTPKLESTPVRIAALGVVIVVAVAAYFGYRAYQHHRAAQVASLVHTTVVSGPKLDRKLVRNIEIAICTAEIARAKDLGMIPTYGGLASPNMIQANVPRRFICEAQTHLTHYFVSADLLCENIRVTVQDPRCISVFRVALKDGTLIYSRP